MVRADIFCDTQIVDHIIPTMKAFIAKQEMVFLATSDADGRAHSSFRAGSPGFVEVVNESTLRFADYRGNGVYSTLGNLVENPYVGLLFIDFFESTVGLHVNGTAAIRERSPEDADFIERWVEIHVERAFMHCATHVPLLRKADKDIHWGSQLGRDKRGDFFKVKPYLRCKVCKGTEMKVCQRLKHRLEQRED